MSTHPAVKINNEFINESEQEFLNIPSQKELLPFLEKLSPKSEYKILDSESVGTEEEAIKLEQEVSQWEKFGEVTTWSDERGEGKCQFVKHQDGRIGLCILINGFGAPDYYILPKE